MVTDRSDTAAHRAEHEAFCSWQAARRRVSAVTGQLTKARRAPDGRRIAQAEASLRDARAAERAARERWERADTDAVPRDPLRGPMARLDAALDRLDTQLARLGPVLGEHRDE